MRLRSIAQLIGVTVSLIAIAIVVAQVDLAATAAVLRQAALLPLGVAVAALIVQLGVLAFRWQTLLPVDAAGRAVPYRAVTEALLVGNLANAVLPGRLGEVARAIAVSRRGRVDVAESVGVVILERVLDLAVLASVGLAAAVAASAPWYLTEPLALVAVVSIAVIVAIMTGIAAKLTDRATAWASIHVSGTRRAAILRWLNRLVDGLHAGQRPRVLLIALAATVISVLLDGLIFWAVGHSLGIELDAAQALLLGTAGILVTGIPSAPANLGTFELAVAWVGTLIGVPTEAGLAIALVAHLIIVLPLSVAGAVVLLRSTRTVNRRGPAGQQP